LLGAFALGALPALLTVQLGMQRVTVSPRVSFVLRRVVPIAAAVVLVARALLMRPDVAQCG
jgi:sulfite exporter TauE/SafE